MLCGHFLTGKIIQLRLWLFWSLVKHYISQVFLDNFGALGGRRVKSVSLEIYDFFWSS